MVTQLNFYSNSDVSIIDLMNTADASFIGTHTVSLTNYDNTSLPAIAIGSIVENNGALFKFEDETAISGSPSDGTVYIYLVPSGDPSLGTATVTPTFTNTAPTWSDSKQGWYGTGGSANYRYLEFTIEKYSTAYKLKDRFKREKKCQIKCSLTGAQSISATTPVLIRFNSVANDTYGFFDTSTYTFTALRTGRYMFYPKVYLSSNTLEGHAIQYFKNGSEVGIERIDKYISASSQIDGIIIDNLNKGDTITFYIDSTGDSSYSVSNLYTQLVIDEI